MILFIESTSIWFEFEELIFFFILFMYGAVLFNFISLWRIQHYFILCIDLIQFPIRIVYFVSVILNSISKITWVYAVLPYYGHFFFLWFQSIEWNFILFIIIIYILREPNVMILCGYIHLQVIETRSYINCYWSHIQI